MIIFLELVFLCIGIYALIVGKITVSKNKRILGWRARSLGIILISVFPVVLAGVWLANRTALLIFHAPLTSTPALFFEITFLAVIFTLTVFAGNKLYTGQLFEMEILPPVLDCTRCRTKLELDPREREAKRFTCPNCQAENNYGGN